MATPVLHAPPWHPELVERPISIEAIESPVPATLLPVPVLSRPAVNRLFRILPRHTDNQFANLLRQSWPAAARFPSPEQLEAFAVPTNQGLRFDNEQSFLPLK